MALASEAPVPHLGPRIPIQEDGIRCLITWGPRIYQVRGGRHGPCCWTATC